MQPNIRERAIRITVVENKTTHLLVAFSDDLPGLMIAARSYEQVERELPGAIREMLEAAGGTVLSVDAAFAKDLPDSFVSRTIVANTRTRELVPDVAG